MAKRDELWRCFATYLNISAAGTFVAAAATTPINAILSDRMSGWTLADMITLLVLGSIFLHGCAQVVLFTRVDP